VRRVPEELARALEGERRRSGRSLNQTVIDLLRRALGLVAGTRYENGLARLAGTWTEEERAAFEAATAPFEQVDDELWR
jgi:hypothetical protein